MNEEKYSICKLCLEQNSELLNIFSDNIDEILQQFPYFKFEDTFASIAVICTDCWRKVRDFHEFCMKIEKIHEETCRLAERDSDFTVFIKVEDQPETIVDLEIKTEEIDIDVESEEQCSRKEECEDFNKVDVTEYSSETEEESIDILSVKRKSRKKSNKKCVDAPKSKRRRHLKEKLEQILREQLSVQVDYRNVEIDYNFITKFMPLKCNICNEPFSTFDESQAHYTEKHKRASFWKCCKIRFSLVSNILDHMEYHRNPDTFKCKVCNRTFRTTHKLHRHIHYVHLKKIKKFQCESCSQEYHDFRKFVNHKMQHVHTNCLICGKSVPIPGLDKHIRAAHTSLEKIVCDICGKVLCNKWAHQQHYEAEHVYTDQRVQCDICKKWLKHKKQLIAHIGKHFLSTKVCDICGKTLMNKYSLASHKLMHKKPKYKCRYCKKPYLQLIQLQEHESIHIGVKDLYKCDFCDKTFRFNSSMYGHRKRAHPQEYAMLKIKRSEPCHKVGQRSE